MNQGSAMAASDAANKLYIQLREDIVAIKYDFDQVMDTFKETAKLEFGLGGSATENNQNEKPRGKSLPPEQPPTRPLRDHGYAKHNRRHRRKEEDRSYRRYSQVEYFDRLSLTKAGSQDHARRRKPRYRRRDKNRSRRQYRPRSGPSKPQPSNLKRLLGLCSIFLHGCFGNWPKRKEQIRRNGRHSK